MEFVRPQLAKKATEKFLSEFVPTAWIAEIKLDGHRRLLGRDVAWSRIGKDHSHPDIQSQIPDGWLLDGEIVPVDGRASSNVVSHYLSECPEKLKFVAFDVLWTAGQNVQKQDWCFRRAVLEGFFKTRPELERLEMSDVHYMTRRSDVDGLMSIAADGDYEGLMLKRQSAPYSPNSRSAWVKHKFVETYDAVITDCDSKPSEWTVRPGECGADGVMYPEGLHTSSWRAGHVNLSYGFYDTDGSLRRVGSFGYTGPRAELEKHVGRVVEVKSFGPQYPTGALRHPQMIGWRDDKMSTDCMFDFEGNGGK